MGAYIDPTPPPYTIPTRLTVTRYISPTYRSHDMTDTDKLREALEAVREAAMELERERDRFAEIEATIRVNARRGGASKEDEDAMVRGEKSFIGWLAEQCDARAALAAAPQPAPDREALVEVIRQVHHIDRDHSEMPALYRAIADALLAPDRDPHFQLYGAKVESPAQPPTSVDREALVEVIDQLVERCLLDGDSISHAARLITDALLARGLRLPGGEETMAWAAKIILSQPKRPDSPVADAFTVACAHLEDRECGAETTNEIIETFLKTLAGEDN